MTISKNSLVLYKNQPAIITQIGDRLTLTLDGGKSVNVRPKDITPLHPGPIHHLAELRPLTGELLAAWELLAGEITSLAELAELIYGDFTPASAWAAWQVLADGLYFKGEPQAITAVSAETVAQIRTARQAKETEAQAYAEFLTQAGRGQAPAGDSPFWREVEELAWGRTDKSRVLRDLGRPQSPENAHRLLLELGRWNHTVNPYPARLNLPVTAPEAGLPALPSENRRDLTHLPAFAIDDAGSEDPDDALSWDGARLWVHVADPAALIVPDSPADLEARARAAKLYLPEMSVPMLPPAATDRLALGLTEISPALSFGLALDSAGDVTDLEITPSWVRVTRLTYEAAETRLAEAPFDHFDRLARQFQARREANGAVAIDLPEVKVRVAAGQVVIRPLLSLRSRDLVREAMLMTGVAVARFAQTHQLALPFTTQDPPDTSDEPLPPGVAGMVAQRRLMKRSQLTGLPGPHTGLGLDLYVQATSPLRRYLDLVMHQQLRAFLRGEPGLDTAAILARVGEADSVTGSVRQAERLSNKHWTLVFLQQNPDWTGEGILVEIRRRRGTVLIPELDLITYVHLREDWPLNQVIPLRLNGVNLPELEAYFQMEA